MVTDPINGRGVGIREQPSDGVLCGGFRRNRRSVSAQLAGLDRRLVRRFKLPSLLPSCKRDEW